MTSQTLFGLNLKVDACGGSPLDIRCGWALASIVGATGFEAPHPLGVDEVEEWLCEARSLGFTSGMSHECAPLLFQGTPLEDAWYEGVASAWPEEKRRWHVVHVLSGGQRPLWVRARAGSGLDVVRSEDREDSGSGEYRFQDRQALLEWFLSRNYVVPSAFLEALESGLGTPREWKPDIADLGNVRQRSFRVYWRLSWENAEIENWETFDNLTEAGEFLGETGVYMALPGNYGAIYLGSMRLHSTRFESDGVDRGDSQINPRAESIDHALYRCIVDAEAAATPVCAHVVDTSQAEPLPH